MGEMNCGRNKSHDRPKEVEELVTMAVEILLIANSSHVKPRPIRTTKSIGGIAISTKRR